MILGIILLVIIGKYFYQLADDFNKNYKWLYPIIGIASYYLGILLFSFCILIIGFFTPSTFDGLNSYTYGVVSLPLGFLASYIVYRLLKRKWKNEEEPLKKDSIEDIGKS